MKNSEKIVWTVEGVFGLEAVINWVKGLIAMAKADRRMPKPGSKFVDLQQYRRKVPFKVGGCFHADMGLVELIREGASLVVLDGLAVKEVRKLLISSSANPENLDAKEEVLCMPDLQKFATLPKSRQAMPGGEGVEWVIHKLMTFSYTSSVNPSRLIKLAEKVFGLEVECRMRGDEEYEITWRKKYVRKFEEPALTAVISSLQQLYAQERACMDGINRLRLSLSRIRDVKMMVYDRIAQDLPLTEDLTQKLDDFVKGRALSVPPYVPPRRRRHQPPEAA